MEKKLEKLKPNNADTEITSHEEDSKNALLYNLPKTQNENNSDIKDVIINALPATMGLLFIFIAETINIIFIGRLNNPELISAIGIGTLYVNVTGYVIGLGLIGGIDTLCSQSYGAKQYKLMGIYVNIGRIVTVGFFILMSIPCIVFAENLLLYIGQTEEIASLASDFCYSMIPSIFFALQYNCSLRYLQAMQIFHPGMIITLITAFIHSFWCYIFIFYFQYGIIGAGIAIGVTQFLNFLFVTIYIHIVNPNSESSSYFPKESFDFGMIISFLKLAVPSTILFAADWIGFEILTFMSSYLGNISLAANVCLFNFISLIFMIPLGISFAVTSLVGNSIGSGNIEKAKKYAIIAILTGMTIVGVLTVFVIVFKSSIPHVYTSDENVIEIVIQLLNIYICFSILDSIQIVEHGILKGLGKQKISSIICLIILYPINIPMAYTFGFHYGLGIIGLWYSQLITVVLLATSYFLILMTCNWEQISKDCILKFEKEKRKLDSKFK